MAASTPVQIDNKYLLIYLEDHLAGATAGLELAKRCAGSNAGSPLGDYLHDELVPAIAQDRKKLEEILQAIGGAPSAVKNAAAWIGERVGRLKLNGELINYSPLSRLIELEALTLGIHGKLCMWSTLDRLSLHEGVLKNFGLDQLILRAKTQMDAVSQWRDRSEEEAFRRNADADS